MLISRAFSVMLLTEVDIKFLYVLEILLKNVVQDKSSYTNKEASQYFSYQFNYT